MNFGAHYLETKFMALHLPAMVATAAPEYMCVLAGQGYIRIIDTFSK